MGIGMEARAKPVCRYGAKCYRKNAAHLNRFSHPEFEEADAEDELPAAQLDASPEKSSDESTPPLKKKRSRVTSKESEAIPPVNGHQSPTNSKSKEIEESADADSDMISIPNDASFADRKRLIKTCFLVDMPADFYDIWALAKSLNPRRPYDAFTAGGLRLTGPFDILSGRFDGQEVSHDAFLRHQRFFYDTPELQTVAVGRVQGYHIGYYRDDPLEMPGLVCANSALKDGRYQTLGDNLFAALFNSLSEEARKQKTSDLVALIEKVKEAAAKGGYSIDSSSPKIRARKKKTCTTSFHGAGLVVPIKGDVGYRELSETNESLKKILVNIGKAKDDSDLYPVRLDKLQEIITYVQFANDECDYGMGYELGVDVFLSGETCLHPQVEQLLTVAYQLLDRVAFTQILRAHLAQRTPGEKVDILERK